MNFWRKWNFKVSEEPDQVVMFVWKRKWSPAVSAISNALRETICDPQHRFALAVLRAFCPPNCLWRQWEITVRVTIQHSSSEQFMGTSQTVSSDLFSQMCLGDYVFLRNGYKMQKLGPGFKHLQVWVFSHLAKGLYLDCISALAKYINLQLLGFFAVPVLGPSELSPNRCMEGYQRKSAHHKFWVNRRRYSSHNIHLTSWIHVKKV